MAAPTNRFKLVEIGLKTAPKLMITFGLVSVVSLFSQAYFHAFIAPEWIGLESAKFFLSNDAVCCIVILLVGFVSQSGSRGLIISGLVGALTVTLTGVLAYYLDRKGLEGLFIASDQQAILLLLVAVSGAVFMWMERSAYPNNQIKD